VKAVQWGIEHEHDAIQCYQTATGCVVQPCGLFLSECGCLGASPDGLVNDNIVLEIKCPYSAGEKTITELCESDKKFYLTRQDESQYYLKVESDYYDQIQGQMYITGRDECHFTVWSRKEVVSLHIAKDPTWSRNLDKLQMFYRNLYLPRLIQKYISTRQAEQDTQIQGQSHCFKQVTAPHTATVAMLGQENEQNEEWNLDQLLVDVIARGEM
jgi:hypothetical protein